MKQRSKHIVWSVALLLGLFAINWLARNANIKWDVTEEKRYSLTPATKKLVANIEEPMEVFVFLENNNLPSAFKRLQNESKTLLRQLEKESKGKLSFRFENPVKGLNKEEVAATVQELRQRGITPTNVRVKTKSGYSENEIFPAALINYGEKQVPVQLLSGQRGQRDVNQSIELLEYRFANAISKLQLQNRPVVAFSTGHGELNPLETEDLRLSLAKNLVASTEVNLAKESLDPSKHSLFIIAKPRTGFSESEKFKVDQYLMNGGKVLFAIDAMKMELDSLQNQWGGRNVAVDYQLNLDDQLFTYGVRINRNLVRDLQSKPIPVIIDENGQSELFPWTFYPVVSSKENHVTNQNVDPVSFEFASGVDTLSIPNVKTSVLLSSSTDAGLVANPVRVDLQELRNPPKQSAFTQQNIPMAVLLEGEFKSLYQYRSAQAEINLSRKDKSLPTSVVVISDGDVLKNTVLPSGETLPLGFDRNIRQQFGNKEFVLNVIDYLLNPEHPLEARNKQFQVRVLNQTKAEKEKSKWQASALLLPTLFIVLFGLLFTFYRKKKYA